MLCSNQLSYVATPKTHEIGRYPISAKGADFPITVRICQEFRQPMDFSPTKPVCGYIWKAWNTFINTVSEVFSIPPRASFGMPEVG